jgi:hypothetical protein
MQWNRWVWTRHETGVRYETSYRIPAAGLVSLTDIVGFCVVPSLAQRHLLSMVLTRAGSVYTHSSGNTTSSVMLTPTLLVV